MNSAAHENTSVNMSECNKQPENNPNKNPLKFYSLTTTEFTQSEFFALAGVYYLLKMAGRRKSRGSGAHTRVSTRVIEYKYTINYGLVIWMSQNPAS